jgi:hypothetical protein
MGSNPSEAGLKAGRHKTAKHDAIRIVRLITMERHWLIYRRFILLSAHNRNTAEVRGFPKPP